MKKKFFTLFAGLISVCLLQAQTWDGSAGTSWNDLNNWTPAIVPTTSSTVTIPNTANKPVLQNNVTITAITMNTGSALDFNGFTLTTSATTDIRGATLNNSNGATDIVITIASAGGSGSNYFGSSTVNDDITLSINSSGTSYEGYLGGNIYNGNTSFILNGTGRLYSSYNQKSSFNGNLTVNRTAVGITDLFNSGFNFITGNFNYTNNAGGDNFINSGNIASGAISGTVNITASGTGIPQFYLRKIKNLTAGGTISVQNSGYVFIESDTLSVVSLDVNGFTGANGDQLTKCVITGNVNFAEDSTNTGSVYFGENIITGNTTLTTNAAVTWYEGYLGGDVYSGNTSFNLNGTGRLYSSYNQKSSFNGNLTVNRTGIGITDLFNAGFNNISGNFSYTNNAGGDNFINSGNIASGAISGTVNITAGGTGNPQFYLRKIKNLTAGGAISVQNSGYVFIENDTLIVVSIDVNGFTGASGDQLTKCVITGNVNFAEAATNTGSVYFGENIITGNTTLTSNTAVTWYESYQGSDTYNGNVSFTRNSATGTLNIAYNDTTYANQDIVFNTTAGIDVNTAIEFGGGASATIEQLGTQPISMPRLIMKKTGGASVTLNDSVNVTTSASFTGGNIITSQDKELVLADNAASSGASLTSHVIGPVVKKGNDAFIFPFGTATSLNTIGMTAPTGATSRFRAEYKNQNPGSDGYNANSKAGTLTNVSHAGYWNVQRQIGATNVNLTLGFGTNPYEQYPVIANLKVAQWNGTQWDDKGITAPTGDGTSGTITNGTALTSYTQFALANVTPIYFYVYSNPGTGPDGTPVKIKGFGGWPGYQTKQLPAGVYSADSVYIVPNATSASFKLRDIYNVDKDDTTITAPVAPTVYISANGNGTKNFEGWRHFVYLTNGSNEIIGAIKDNDLTLGNTTMTAYFSTPNVATAPNGGIYLKRSFKITSQFAPVGTKRVRFYISKTEYNNLVAADPASFPNGINSLTITKYTGPMEDSLFNPLPGSNSSIIPNNAITIADLGTMYSLDIDVTGFSGFYIGGNQSNVSVCNGSNISIPSDISGATYQWQVDNGGGYTPVSNGGVYGGATTNTLTLTNAPSSMYGYKLRALVNGSLFSQVYTIKFKATWMGTVNNVWENPANWSCAVLPDANTDVIISAGKPNYPMVNANTTIRTLDIRPGASGTVSTGATITIVK